MKRLIVVLGCLSIFYAAAVWALEGCRDFGVDVKADHRAEKASSNHHHEPNTAHHSHSDPSKIHCPNVFGEFLISPRTTLTYDPGFLSHIALADVSLKEFLPDGTSGGIGDGPPGSVHSKHFPRHLLLSVIRI